MSKQADDLDSRLRRGMFTRYTEAVARVARPEHNERHALAACNEDPYVFTENVTLRRGESGSVGLQFYQPSCPGPCIIVGLVRACLFLEPERGRGGGGGARERKRERRKKAPIHAQVQKEMHMRDLLAGG